MQLPYTSNSLLFWLDPAKKYIAVDSSNRIISMLNKVDGNPILPNTTFGPTWVDNSLNGQPTLSFSGAERLLFNMNDNVSSVGIQKPFMMIIVARTLTFAALGNFLIMAANKTIPQPCYFIEFGNIGGQNLIIDQRTTDTSQLAISPFTIVTDSNYHIFTTVYDGFNLKLRIDGTEVDSTSATGLTAICSINQICIGGVSPTKIAGLGSSSFLTGNVATTLAYTSLPGVPFDYSIENYLMNFYNLPTR